MNGGDRRQRTGRLVERYADHLLPGTADGLRSMVRHGELGLAVEDLAAALVQHKVPLYAGDAVDFRQLLAGFQRCPDTPPDIEDLVVFGAGPPETYALYLFGSADPFATAAATVECLPVPAARIGVLVDGVPVPGTPDRPAVLIQHDPSNGDMSVEFWAGCDFGRLVDGAPVLEVARKLSRSTGASAMLDAHGLTPNQWVLVTSAGGHGVVMVDGEASDEGRWEILFAYEPIEGALNLPVRRAR
ncbi:DUF6189 family protein [Glycomyces niveus]|uniref:ESX secretion-associated protein EspG n=1 Tax=Glycomyces niveus TaxID=2820287 RepID=A0ABS3TYS3_9ACTN|nr:DUF6189 family protein [Glycomyces sp. NEAU-S30]MBO3731667.1 hypothetical protein [Glycomyces sp. NEAU-S30]